MIANVHNAQDALTIDFDKPVKVYFNFPRKMWSIVQGNVRAHCEYVCLRDVEFRVSERGRQRVIREQRKNVHAVAVGYIVTKPAEVPYDENCPWTPIEYNPYINETFVTRYKKTPVLKAKYADFDSQTPINKVLAKI